MNSLKLAELHSNTDALTGLANRRSLEAFLRSAQIAAMETGEPLSILMIDIDHFKKFNDSYGHQVGDQVLRLVARVLQDSVRESDLAARYGGEELMAVLPGANLDICAEVARTHSPPHFGGTPDPPRHRRGNIERDRFRSALRNSAWPSLRKS